MHSPRGVVIPETKVRGVCAAWSFQRRAPSSPVSMRVSTRCAACAASFLYLSREKNINIERGRGRGEEGVVEKNRKQRRALLDRTCQEIRRTFLLVSKNARRMPPNAAHTPRTPLKSRMGIGLLLRGVEKPHGYWVSRRRPFIPMNGSSFTHEPLTTQQTSTRRQISDY